MRPILLARRTCLETTGSRVVWYSLRADCKFSAPLFARHLPKTAASNIDMFMLLRPWGVVGWAASPSNTTLSQKICSKGSVSNIKFKKGSFVSWMTHELRNQNLLCFLMHLLNHLTAHFHGYWVSLNIF